jgi:hypothetical protein
MFNGEADVDMGSESGGDGDSDIKVDLVRSLRRVG